MDRYDANHPHTWRWGFDSHRTHHYYFKFIC